MDSKSANKMDLVKLIERLDAPDLKQIMAFSAGYEAGKIGIFSEHSDAPAADSPPDKPNCTEK